MYDGVPLVAKWITVQTTASASPVKVKIAAVEKLATNWQWSQQGRDFSTFYLPMFIYTCRYMYMYTPRVAQCILKTKKSSTFKNASLLRRCKANSEILGFAQQKVGCLFSTKTFCFFVIKHSSLLHDLFVQAKHYFASSNTLAYLKFHLM
jgi:hypothetical protein